MRSALRSLWRITMSWDRKTERRTQYTKRRKVKSNSTGKKHRKIRKEELRYQEDLKDYDH